MWALIVDGSINRIFKVPTAFKHPTTGLQYPRNWLNLATDSEKSNVGFIEVTFTGSHKDSDYYNNAESSPVYNSGAGTVVITKSSTAKNLADLKTSKLESARARTYQSLLLNDWYIVRKSEHSTAIPAKIIAFRLAARTVYGKIQTAITNASDVDAVAAVYTSGDSARDTALSVDGTSSSVVSTSNNTITSSSHGFVDDELVVYSSGIDGSGDPYGAIGGLVDGKSYYVYGKTTNTFKLSHTNSFMGDAAAISLTDVASGGTAHTFTSNGVSVVGQSMPTTEIDSYNVSV
jgi:hypothetical protein